MTAVATPQNFPLNKPAWGGSGGLAMNPDDGRGMFVRKNLQRTNSSSSVSSTGSNSSTTTVATNGSQNGTPASSTGSGGEVSQWPNTATRKRPQTKGPWPAGKSDAQSDFARMTGGRPQMNSNLGGGQPMHPPQGGQPQAMGGPVMARPTGDQGAGQPVLYLLSLNGTFERKTIHVPYLPDVVKIGRQTNVRTVPTPQNGYFDSKVLSRQHAEIWAERNGKIYIRDVKSSNGTFVNGNRLSQENRESEPHELQTADHLELGIDIVSEDQKTVVHHKVAAKVEHAGFLSSSSNLMDVNFGDLDPANGAMMIPAQLTNQLRARNGVGASVAGNARAMPGAGMGAPAGMGYRQQAIMWSPVPTESIVKKLQTEMRSARLQSQDLNRTSQFLNSLLSKDEVKDQDKPEAEQAKQAMVNGNGLAFRADPKTRFSDPPAPPPQQPLPEKPDIPSLKRGTTERPKSHPSNTSPTRDTVSQILQLQEDLKNTKKALESRDAKVRELEETVLKERSARENAEELAKRLEESATAAAAAAVAAAATKMNGAAKSSGSDALLEEAFEPPQDVQSPGDMDTPTSDVGKSLADQVVESTQAAAAEYQAQIDALAMELRDMKQQLDSWRQRTEKAEAERDADRKTLAEMVAQIKRDEEARQAAAVVAAAAAAAREKSRGRSKGPKKDSTEQNAKEENSAPPTDSSDAPESVKKGSSAGDDPEDAPTLSRANTITPKAAHPSTTGQDAALAASLPYASMLGVVLLGIGLMSYLNWQPSPKLDR